MTSATQDAFEHHADSYAAFLTSERGRQRAERSWRWLSDYLPKAGWVLDAGGGGGALAPALESEGLRVVVLDRSLAMLAHALRAANGRDRKPVCVRGCIGGLPFRSSSFDVVTCHAVLEYLPGQLSRLGELASVVAPGGLLSLETLRAGVCDGENDEVFGVERLGLKSSDIHEVLGGHGLSVFASRHDDRRLHVLARARV